MDAVKLYALVHSSASDYPEAGVRLISDRVRAADEWRQAALELEGYPDDDVDAEHLTTIGRIADDFLMNVADDASHNELLWVVGQEGPLDEMSTVQLFVLEVDGP